MNVGDPGMFPKALADFREYSPFIIDAVYVAGLGGQVFFDVAIDQVLDGRRFPALALFTCGIDTHVDLPAELLRPGGQTSAETDRW